MISSQVSQQWEDYIANGGHLNTNSYNLVVTGYQTHQPSLATKTELPRLLVAPRESRTAKILSFLLDHQDSLSFLSRRDLTQVNQRDIASEAIWIEKSLPKE